MHKKRFLYFSLIIVLTFIAYFSIKEVLFYRKTLNSYFSKSYVNLIRRSQYICDRIDEKKDHLNKADIEDIFNNFMEIQEELIFLSRCEKSKNKKDISNDYIIRLSLRLNGYMNNNDYINGQNYGVIQDTYNVCKKILNTLENKELDNTLKNNTWMRIYEQINYNIVSSRIPTTCCTLS